MIVAENDFATKEDIANLVDGVSAKLDEFKTDIIKMDFYFLDWPDSSTNSYCKILFSSIIKNRQFCIKTKSWVQLIQIKSGKKTGHQLLRCWWMI